jgi:hypothetical protein
MPKEEKTVETMTFNEYKEWAARYLFDRLIMEGFKGMVSALYMVMIGILDNKEFGGKLKKRK